jgi:uncharacterized membrane protein
MAETDPMTNRSLGLEAAVSPGQQDKFRATELLISNTLRTGVGLSFLVIVLGIVLTFYHHPEYLSHRETLPAMLHPAEHGSHYVREILDGIPKMDGGSLVMLGLFILILTPIARVAISILAFVHLRDRPFVCITILVLTLLLLSFVLGRARGG